MSPREILEDAMRRTSLDLEALAERLGKKVRTMKAIRSGEIPLAENVKLHIQDLVALIEMRRSKSEKTGSGGRVAPIYSKGPRGHFSTRLVAKETESGAREPDAEIEGSCLTVEKIPLLSWTEAGELQNWDDAHQYGEAVAYGSRDPKALGVRIRGRAMEPEYGEGTIAVVYLSHQPRNGDLVMAWLAGGGLLFNRLQTNGEQLTFISSNPVYPPVTLEKSQVAMMAPVGITQRAER